MIGKNTKNLKYPSEDNILENDKTEEDDASNGKNSSIIFIDDHSDNVKFDRFIEELQELVIEDEFEALRHSFLDKYCDIFEDTDENKLIYTDIFNEYIKILEFYIESNLQKRLNQFKIQEFYELLIEHKDEVDEQLYEFLLSFSDFLVFKELILEFKRNKDKKDGLSIFGKSLNEENLNGFKEV